MNAGTGALIRARRLRMGLSVSGLAKEAKVDRGRIAALEAGETNVRATTIGAVEAALDRLEHEMGMDAPSGTTVRPIGDPSDELVEFRVSGAFGVQAVVKGPIKDIEALQEAVSKLIAGMRIEDADEGGS